MATPTLPSDIIIDILTRLPSKTLIRFKSVSKQWYSLINSPDFANLHLSQTLISQNSPNLIVSESSLFFSLISDNYTNPNLYFSELDHPLKHLSETSDWLPQILGSINGILCIALYDKSSVVLYNPSTKTHRFIPPFTPSPNTNPHFEINPEGTNINVVLFGFGFDSVSGDYKLVRIIETLKNHVLVYREASVYSLRSDSWKCVKLSPKTKGYLTDCRSGGVLVNEALHFIVLDAEFNPKAKCFNLGTEIFSLLDFPKYDEGFSRKSYVIKELGGCFSVLVNYQLGMPDNTKLARADLWVMKEYGNEESWFRLFSISDPTRLEVLNQVRPIVYSRDKERVLLELDGLSFGWYSWGSKSLERITVHGGPSVYAPCEKWTFVDSLVSIEKDKDMDKGKMKPKVVTKKNIYKRARDDFLSSGFKLRL